MIRSWRDYDFFLIGCVLVLAGFSMAMVYSATLNNALTEGYFSRHLVNMGVGLVVMVLLTALHYHALQSWTIPLYVAMVAVLAAVLILGRIRSGAQSWLDFGLRTFQPSEAAKLILIVVLAAYWARFEQETMSWKALFGSLLIAGIPLGLVFIQPDFGTALVFASIWLAITWTAGMRWWHILALGAAAVPAVVFGWNEVLQDYQRDRLLIFIDPLKYDPELKNGAWNIMQSLTAISSGGLMGHGWMQGLLSQGQFLPVQYTDFIFAVTSEELGFVGATVMLVFLGALIWQSFTVADIARDTFGRLIAVGIGAMFLTHTLVNVGMNMSMMPITGIPLPFISYGGSFTLTSLAAIGLLQSIALRRRRIVF